MADGVVEGVLPERVPDCRVAVVPDCEVVEDEPVADADPVVDADWLLLPIVGDVVVDELAPGKVEVDGDVVEVSGEVVEVPGYVVLPEVDALVEVEGD